MNHHMWCSKPKIFTLALCGKCLLIPSLKRRAEISITVHKFTYEETCNLFFYIFTLFQAPFCQGGINHSAKLAGVMAMFLCSSKVTGCVSVSHPYRHPLRCPPFPLLFSGPAFPSIHWPCQVFSSFLDSGLPLRLVPESINYSAAPIVQQGWEFHHTGNFFLCASLGATQRMCTGPLCS